MATSKQAQQFAKQLTELSLGLDGAVDAERVAGVLAYLAKHPPAQPMVVLKAYHRRIERELKKTHAIVEHAGEVSSDVLAAIGGALSQKYHRSISTTASPNDALLAGLRVRIADDIYESTVSGQLDELAASL